ncbi:MAG: hypothetical protein MK212_07720 [Saprospiraceae bacterium]|nr:hypothetical protein [Saprospiraceae bacterium]
MKQEFKDKNIDKQDLNHPISMQKIALQLDHAYTLAGTFGIYSKFEKRYETEFGGIMLNDFEKEKKEMAERIAQTEANHLVFRCSFRKPYSFNRGTVEQVCDNLTSTLRYHLKEIQGKNFKGLTHEIAEIKQGEGKDMAGYFVLLKKK